MAIKCPKCQFDNPEDTHFCGKCATPLEPSEDIPVTETLETPKEKLTRGTTFAGRYEIIEELGKGGMGRVYRVEDTKLKQEVALKLIRPEIAKDKKTIERFRNELKLARNIRHKNVCGMFDLGETEGAHFITMEYVRGEDLKSFIHRSGQLAVGTAVRIAKQVCEGLSEAHKLGVVHRDLKSNNIMIDKEGNVRIMDFGIARSLEAKGITGTGVMIGTPEYISPEQVEGKETDQRTDIYSLGVILYEMVTGMVPFEGDTPLSVAYKHKHETPHDPRKINTQIPEGLNSLILRCLEKDKEKRYQSAGEIHSELTNIEKGFPTTERFIIEKKPKTVKVGKINFRNFILYGGVITLVIILVLGGIDLLTGGKTVRKWLSFELGPSRKGLAIFPLTVIEGDSYDQAFSDGLVEVVSTKLTQLESFKGLLWVIPTHEVRTAGITSPSEAKQELGVDLVVTGNMRRIDNIIRLSLNLIDANTLLQIGSPLVITDPITNLYTWQEDIFIKLLQMLDIKHQPQMNLIWATGETALPDAYEFYLKGLGFIKEHEKLDKLDKAIGFFERAVEIDPQYALARSGLGKAFWLKYKLTKNSDWFDEAKTNFKLAIQNDERLVPGYISLGMIYRDTGRYEAAISEFQRALQIEPRSYHAYLELGLTYEQVERFVEAEETYKKAIKLRPNYSKIYSYLGYFYYINGRLHEAEKMFSQAMELAPGYINSYYNLGAIYFLRKQYELAEAVLKKSIIIKPNATAYSNLGTIYFYQRRYGNAVDMFEKAVNLEENDYMIWGNLADAYRFTPGYKEKAQDTYEHAIELAKKELSKKSEDAILLSRLASYYAVIKDVENALAKIIKARNLAPNNVPVIMNSIGVFELIGKRDQAIKALLEYIQKSGSMEEIIRDPDLAGLRADPRYQQIIKK